MLHVKFLRSSRHVYPPCAPRTRAGRCVVGTANASKLTIVAAWLRAATFLMSGSASIAGQRTLSMRLTYAAGTGRYHNNSCEDGILGKKAR